MKPMKWSDHPMYTCRLEGCKSAWGTSDDELPSEEQRFSLRDALDLGMLGDQFDNTATSFLGFAGLVGYAWSDYACHGPACPSLARIDLIRDEWTLWNVCCT